MSTNTAAGLTVTPIFWEPTVHGHYAFPGGYESIIDRYVADVAAASGSTDNVYSVATEYYDVATGVKSFISYDIRAGGPVVDTDPFPGNGCRPAPGYMACISDAQLRTELRRVTGNLRLPTDLAHFYPVFFPPGVETMDSDGSNSDNGYCGYHRAFGSGPDQIVYADMPYETSGCDGGQAPNGNLPADGEVSTLSHELMETITDPLSPDHAWSDKAGNEIGDMCSQVYGPPLGSTNPSDPGVTEYNQVINGGRYYTQEMFSNLAFSRFGTGKGCALSEALAQGRNVAGTGSAAPTVTFAFADADPTTLAANGTSTARIVVTVGNQGGHAVAGDHVHFSLGVQHGSGLCGHLSSTDKVTGNDGRATVTYTASTFKVQCWVLAVEADGGRGAESVIYQGSTRTNSPSIEASFPTSLHAGGSPATFTMRAAGPSAHPVPNARVYFFIYRGTPGSRGVSASQVHMWYSTTGPKGRFKRLALTGSTGGGRVIDGSIGPQSGETMEPGSAKTMTFRVGLAWDVPASKTAGPLLAFEGYLDQVNSASGSGTTLAETTASRVRVPSAAPSNMLMYVAIGAGALVIVLAVLGVLLRGRRKGHPEQPPPADAAA